LPGQNKHNVPWLWISLVLTVLLLLGAVGAGVWAYQSRQDYKLNTDKKVDAAVKVAEQKTATAKDKEFVEEEKKPLKSYKGPATYGSLDIMYPKTWSAFISQSNPSSPFVDGYLHPNFVPGLQSGTAFALRIQVTNQQYSNEIRQFENKIKNGKVTIKPYKAPKVPDVLGSRVDGEINAGQKDSMVLFPVRDKTLKIWTESDQFDGDLENIILANLSFVP
jgi:cytoskeletal protein RodZ